MSYDRLNDIIIRTGLALTPQDTCSIPASEAGLWNNNGTITYRDAAGIDHVVKTATGSAGFFAAITKTAAPLAGSPVYDNGTDGVGATLTRGSNGAIGTVGGVGLTSADVGKLILVDSEATAAHNGIYVLSVLGTGSVKYKLTRLAGFDTADTIVDGALVGVQQGTYADQLYVQYETVATIGTDDINFQLSATAVTFTAVNAALATADATIDVNAQALVDVGNITHLKEANHAHTVAASTTATTAGGNLATVAGAGNTTGAGGAASLTGGAGGNDAAGGAASVTGGAAGGGNRAGGAAAVTGGAGAGTQAGGAAGLTGGVGGATGAGGAVAIAGGAGGATSGTGGAVTVAGGAGSAGNANGGALALNGGAKNGSGADGAVSIAGVGSSLAIGNSGAVATWSSKQAAGAATNTIADPGTGQAIPVTTSGMVPLTIAGAGETNTLAIPAFVGQVLDIIADTLGGGGDRAITSAQAINQAGNTVMTFAAAADFIRLVACTIGGALRWRVAANDGVALS